ncbi:glycosyltransferase family 4 protein [Pseudoalteromonas denitrificans]|uniref:Glycosyltransferase involved in cell wall bisynthesis n=1 Tax=Pseudoalteromonas denitrificans DSM 6059 TaxID=1123010 RepID=A0A1I1SDZ6_9GAMM|nr:glycosyltransferase family 4 protein [Pseudoalteromonas denitrificans]SFD44687.1 Glycosyltransferase involved in cell wall bisynthesis [Pseudoalteromonas denitrificans DSM 6059]
MKKVCFISNLFPSKEDPTFGSFVGLSFEQLKKMGYNLDQPIVMDARLGAFKKLFAYISFFFRGLKATISNKYDFYYIHYLTYSTLCLLPVLPFKKVKYLINIHGDDLVGTRLIHKIMGFPSPYILKHATAIVVPSAYFKRSLLELHPKIAENKVVISESAGFKEAIFFPKPKLKKENKKIHFGYISRVDEGKGWEVMLEALAILKESNLNEINNLTLSVYGAGSQTQAFDSMVQEFELEKIVTYYGPLEQSKLGEKYRSFDYFLFPTRRESFGLVAAESLACGTPVVCSEIEPLTDIVFDNKNGFLFKDGSAEDLYKRILHCFSISEENYSSLVENAIDSSNSYKSVKVSETLYKNMKSLF